MTDPLFTLPGAQTAPCYVCETETSWRVAASNGGHVPICSEACGKHWPQLFKIRDYVRRLEKYITSGDFDIARTAVSRWNSEESEQNLARQVAHPLEEMFEKAPELFYRTDQDETLRPDRVQAREWLRSWGLLKHPDAERMQADLAKVLTNTYRDGEREAPTPASNPNLFVEALINAHEGVLPKTEPWTTDSSVRIGDEVEVDNGPMLGGSTLYFVTSLTLCGDGHIQVGFAKPDTSTAGAPANMILRHTGKRWTAEERAKIVSWIRAGEDFNASPESHWCRHCRKYDLKPEECPHNDRVKR